MVDFVSCLRPDAWRSKFSCNVRWRGKIESGGEFAEFLAATGARDQHRQGGIELRRSVGGQPADRNPHVAARAWTVGDEKIHRTPPESRRRWQGPLSFSLFCICKTSVQTLCLKPARFVEGKLFRPSRDAQHEFLCSIGSPSEAKASVDFCGICGTDESVPFYKAWDLSFSTSS